MLTSALIEILAGAGCFPCRQFFGDCENFPLQGDPGFEEAYNCYPGFPCPETKTAAPLPDVVQQITV